MTPDPLPPETPADWLADMRELEQLYNLDGVASQQARQIERIFDRALRSSRGRSDDTRRRLEGVAMESKFIEMEVAGESVDIMVDEAGQFSCHVNGVKFEGATLSRLKDKLKRLERKQATAAQVQATIYKEPSWMEGKKAQPTFEDVVIVGENKHTHRLACRTSEGQGGSISIGYDDVVMRRLTNDEKLQFLRARREKLEAEKVFESMKEAWTIDGKKTLANAMRAGTEEDPTDAQD